MLLQVLDVEVSEIVNRRPSSVRQADVRTPRAGAWLSCLPAELFPQASEAPRRLSARIPQ